MAHEILLPALSPTMTTGNLTRWLKKEGDKIEIGDVVAEIETDKAVMEVEALEEGILAKILIAEGAEDVAIKTPIALVADPGEKIPEDQPAGSKKAAESPAAEEKQGKPKTSSGSSGDLEKKIQTAEQKKEGEGSDKERIFASPLARRIAKENNIELNSLDGTGPNGRIVRRDVETLIKLPLESGKEPPKTAEPPSAPVKEEELPEEDKLLRHSLMRKVIARRLVESKQQAPHFYVSKDVKLDKLLALRQDLNKAGEEKGFRISVNDMVIKAAALALRENIAMNVVFEENHMRHLKDIDISIVVSLPEGLITPIVRKADKKTLREISAEAKDLVARARSKKLAFEEYQGGSFSISNLGMYDVKEFTSIINPPQSAILAVGTGKKRPIVTEDGQLGIATVMTVNIAVDHRSIDGALAAQWLTSFKKFLENPLFLVV